MNVTILRYNIAESCTANKMPLDFEEGGNPSAFERHSDTISKNLDKLVQEGCIYRHQADAVRAIKEELESAAEESGPFRNISLAVLPTGTGKTGVCVLAAYACRAHKVLVITPSETISKQQLTQFKRVDLQEEERESKINPLKTRPFFISRKIIDVNKKCIDWAPSSGMCVLKTAELLTAREDECELVVANAHKFGDGTGKGVNIGAFPRDHFSLVIVDEAHHYPAKTWKNIVEHFKTKILFLTATPKNKGKYILNTPDENGTEIEKRPCFVLSKSEAVSQGIIRETKFKDIRDHPGIEFLSHEPREVRKEQIRQVLESVRETLKDHDKQDPEHRHKAMVLATGIEDAKAIEEMWNEQVNDGLGCCKTFVQNDKIDNVRNFEDPTSDVRVLVVIYRLTEGFDCKNVSVAAILRNVGEKAQIYFAQFVGRAVRKLHKDDPVVATVISHVQHHQRKNYDIFYNETLAEDDPQDLPDEGGNDPEE